MRKLSFQGSIHGKTESPKRWTRAMKTLVVDDIHSKPYCHDADNNADTYVEGCHENIARLHHSKGFVGKGAEGCKAAAETCDEQQFHFG